MILGVRAVTSLQAIADYEEKVFLHIDEATRIVQSSLELNFHALRDIDVILKSAGETATSKTRAFHSYVERTAMFNEFPALRGMAVFELVTTDQLSGLVVKQDADLGRREIGCPPLAPKALVEGNQHAIITLIAPVERGGSEVGADIMARDRARVLREAIQRQELAISPPFQLFTGETAVSLFRPFYQSTEADIPAGFIATTLSTERLLEGLESRLAPFGLELSVSDAGTSAEAASNPESAIQISSNLTSTERLFNREIDIGGRRWRLDLRAVEPPPKLIAVDFLSFLAMIAAGLAGFLLYRTLRSADTLANEVKRRAKELDNERREVLGNARIDELTGLLNRTGLHAAYSARIDKNESLAPTLISFDLDHFRQINGTLGHASGDDLLRAFSNILLEICPDGAILVRFGGDEFGVLLFESVETAVQTAEAVLSWTRSAQLIGGHVMRFGTSAGIAKGCGGRSDLASLVVNADIALYAAKDRGRDNIAVFDDDMRQRVVESKSLADDIWRGLENNEFVPFFQSQHDAKTHELMGIEVLVRWQHPERGVLPPVAFLQVADKTGAAKVIDRRVLQLAGEAVHRLEARGFHVPKFSVNVSLKRMLEDDVLQSIDALPKTDAQLTFEILESDFLDGPSDALLWRLGQLREAGVSLEVDDFGSGRASVIALKLLNPDRLKIDKGLISPIIEDPSMKSLVASMVEMGRALGIAITAEGIETAMHADVAVDLGIDTLQGYYFSKPISEQDLARKAIAA